MRSPSSQAKLLGVVFAVSALVLLFAPAASAQLPIDPTVTPELNNGGWVYDMAILLFALGALVTLLVVVGYMRFAPRFQRAEEGAPRTSRADRIVPGREPPRRPVNVVGPPILVPAPVAVGAAAAPAPAPASPAPAPAAASVPQPAPAEAATAESAQAPVAPAPEVPLVAPSAPAAAPTVAPAPAPAAGEHAGPAELDQETFDRVLAELLEKGTDRRVAEGQARRAAVVAARKKAGG